MESFTGFTKRKIPVFVVTASDNNLVFAVAVMLLKTVLTLNMEGFAMSATQDTSKKKNSALNVVSSKEMLVATQP